MRIETKWNLPFISKGGYLHCHLLTLTAGTDGFIIYIPLMQIRIIWGEAYKKYKEKNA